MAYDHLLADRIRSVVPASTPLQERKMFGGLAFLAGGHLACGIVGDRLMIRVDREAYQEALSRPHVKPMDFTGREMRGFVYVEPAGIADDSALGDWVRRGIAYAASLPPK